MTRAISLKFVEFINNENRVRRFCIELIGYNVYALVLSHGGTSPADFAKSPR